MTTTPMRVRVVACTLRGDFSDPVRSWHTFLEAVNAVPDVTVLATQRHIFPGNGLSGVVIIGESHAALHTWPEQECAYALLASCSTARSLVDFVTALRERWDVETVSHPSMDAQG
jgi:S-adenosylmethionine/arginine decarboxylase-like enzyme